jgi:hypothetical protein
MSNDIYEEIVGLVARHAKEEGENATTIDSLLLWRDI